MSPRANKATWEPLAALFDIRHTTVSRPAFPSNPVRQEIDTRAARCSAFEISRLERETKNRTPDDRVGQRSWTRGPLTRRGWRIKKRPDPETEPQWINIA